MKKFYRINCNKYRRFKNPKISYIFDKAYAFSVIFGYCSSEGKKIFKEEESIEILKTLGLINNMKE